MNKVENKTTNPFSTEQQICTETNISELKKKLLVGEITQEEYNKLSEASLYCSDINQFSNLEKLDTQNTQDELKTAHRFKEILTNKELLNDDVLLEELKKIENIDLTTLLIEYRDISNGNGLLDTIIENKEIKDSTKKKFEETFTQILEDDYVFDINYKNNGDKVYFETKNLSYESQEYNITQKDRNILEIENTDTKEKRIIDFRKLLPTEIQGINDIISLKATIQNLPGEVLFQIPHEISFIVNRNILDTNSIIPSEGLEEADGMVTIIGKDKNIQLFISSDSTETIVHELSHAIFANKNGNDALLKNEKFMNNYKIATEKLKKENLSYEKDGDEYYWSTKPQEMGAVVLTSIMLCDYEKIEKIEKYAPDITKTVLEIYENCKQQPKADKHTPLDIDGFFNYLKPQ